MKRTWKPTGMVRLRTLMPVLMLTALLGVVGAASGCRDEREDDVVVVDPALVAFLSKARAAHHRADLAERVDDVPTAIETVASIVSGPRPQATPEVLEVLADAHARLADLRSRRGDLDGADREVDAGLALATAVTHFRGHLFEMRGVVAERRADDLTARGDAAGAAAARERAIHAYEEAIDVQDEVIRAALRDDGTGEAPEDTRR
jgi:hypothetical protein